MSTGHGNHWECLQKPAEEAIKHFIPIALVTGKLRDSIRRVGMWFDRKEPSEEVVHSIILGSNPLAIMALLVTQQAEKRSTLYSAFPYASKVAKKQLRLTEIRDWGNEIEAVLVGENKDGVPVAFFDTGYFVHRDRYRIGADYYFGLAGLIYTARCTNEETIEITDPKRIAEHAAAFKEEPERLPDGTLAPLVIHVAGCTGHVPVSEEYPEDAEFYCVIGKVVQFELEGIRIFQITPKSGDRKVPLPGVIFGAASVFTNGYIPKPGDSIGGGLWTQGFLDQTAKKAS